MGIDEGTAHLNPVEILGECSLGFVACAEFVFEDGMHNSQEPSGTLLKHCKLTPVIDRPLVLDVFRPRKTELLKCRLTQLFSL